MGDRDLRSLTAHEAAERHVRDTFPPLACSSFHAALFGLFGGAMLLIVAGAFNETGPQGVGALIAWALAIAVPFLIFRLQERERSRAYSSVFEAHLADANPAPEERSA